MSFKSKLRRAQRKLKRAQRKMKREARKAERQAKRQERKAKAVLRKLKREASNPKFKLKCSCGFSGTYRKSALPRKCPLCGADVIGR